MTTSTETDDVSASIADIYRALTVGDMRNVECVTRWHMVRMQRQQSLADHSYRVALIASGMASRLQGSAALGLAEWGWLHMYALLHDVDELDYGDIPTVTKPHLVRVKHLAQRFWQHRGSDMTPEQMVPEHIAGIVKVADILESLQHYKEYGFNDKNHGSRIKAQIENALSKYIDFMVSGQRMWPIICDFVAQIHEE